MAAEKIPQNVYFLGAGASASGGIPIFSNPRKFHEKANEVLENISRNEGKDLVQKVIDHWTKYFENYNIEDYYVAIELDEQLGCKDIISAEEIKGFLGCIIDNIRKKLSTQEYRRLITGGAAKAIITTNWDFLLEQSITELQNLYLFSWDEIPENGTKRLIEYLMQKYHIDWVKTAKFKKINDDKAIRVSTEKNSLFLTLKDNKIYVDLGINGGITDEFITKMENGKLNIYKNFLFEESAPINYSSAIKPNYNVLEQTGSHPPIFKLHGSLNWGYCKKCEQLYYFNGTVFKYLATKAKKYPNMTCNKHSDVELMPFIVPPTLSKLKTGSTTERTPYVRLYSIWKKAYDYLKSCEKLCFIGYSFPEADMQMKFFISNAIRKNSNLKEVMVVTRPKKDERSKKDFQGRYDFLLSRAISNPKVCFYYNGFEEFCKNVL